VGPSFGVGWRGGEGDGSSHTDSVAMIYKGWPDCHWVGIRTMDVILFVETKSLSGDRIRSHSLRRRESKLEIGIDPPLERRTGECVK
jgi:hypothetical protein